MAVYTQVRNEELDIFLADYRLGRVLAFKAIAEGVENSNYFLQTEQGSFILTLYEKRVDESDLPFFLGLINHLGAKGLRVATALTRADGAYYGYVANRAAAVLSFLPGRWESDPSADHCAKLGEALAKLHTAAADFAQRRENRMGIAYWEALLRSCQDIDSALYQELAQEIDHIKALWPESLPRGIIHGDLFPDNVLFDDLDAGMIDFYFACEDMLSYDIAVCLNAWCWQKMWHKNKARALVKAYAKQRALSADELAALPILCRGAAMRFLLTRLADRHAFEQGMSFVLPKNPDEYLELLRFHQNGSAIL